jgi:hypothetical protein
LIFGKSLFKTTAPPAINGRQRSPEQMDTKIRRLQQENDYLKQREIPRKVMSIAGRNRIPVCGD